MGRLHLFEFEDQTWFPAALRTAMTSYLAAVYRVTPLARVWAEQIATVLRETNVDRIVDIGSGSGGPIPMILEELERLGHRPQVTLTDVHPDLSACAIAKRTHSIDYWPEPVSADRLPASLIGLRTMFSSFHHFRPDQARAILRDAMLQRQPICIFEATSRTPAYVASSLLIPIFVWFMMPRVRPLTFFRLFFTYVVPALPLLIFWDGAISQLRTYSVAELKGLTDALQAPGYAWHCQELPVPGSPGGVPLLIGRPVKLD